MNILLIIVLYFPILSTCNLKCDNCSSYSNLNVKGAIQTIEKAKNDFANWKPFINPLRLQILGGEPLLHKELFSFIKAARQAFPTTDLRIYTNGLLLKKPLTPDKKEISQNIRCRSAKLRYAIRNNNSFFSSKMIQKKFKNYFQIEEMRL